MSNDTELNSTTTNQEVSKYNSLFQVYLKLTSLLILAVALYLFLFTVLGDPVNSFQVVSDFIESHRISISTLLTILLTPALYTILNSKKNTKFRDIDSNYESTTRQKETKYIIDAINNLKNDRNEVNATDLINKIASLYSFNTDAGKEKNNNFKSYFLSIIERLEKQIDISDKKASELLDKGTSYARNGIMFFIVSIVVWQVASGIWGFKEHFIYGMASCSLVFIFIEFISAWFLKQYKSFTDTSTYIIKVKSIFDKYLLVYFALQDVYEDNSKHSKKVIDILGEEIHWPDTYLLKKGDLGFAKEAIEAMTHFASSMKSEFKNMSQRNDSKPDK